MLSPQPQQQPEWSAILEVQDPDGRRTRHPFRHPRVAVGRRPDNDLSLADQGVSHQHCEFIAERGFFVVRDLGSHNGTFVNDRRVGEARLRDGDEVRIGGTRIRVALQGKVRSPPRRVRWTRAVLPILVAAVAAAGGWRLWQRERDLRTRYVAALREHLARDPCAAPQLEGLAAIDARIASRSFAIALERGAVRISPSDERADLELLDLYRRRLRLYADLETALAGAQQQERESVERISRLGQRFASARDRKLAQWAEGILQEREKEVAELAEGVRALTADTQKLVGLVESVVVRREGANAAALAGFRFAARDLQSLAQACRTGSERIAGTATGALNALAE